MWKLLAFGLALSVITMTAFIWTGTPTIKHYTAAELMPLTCAALGERHEEVITAYHDAEIAHFRKTGAFHDDLGIPSEDVIPYSIVIKQFLREHNIVDAAMSPILNSDFYAAVSGICASNPSWQATDAMRQVAISMELIDG